MGFPQYSSFFPQVMLELGSQGGFGLLKNYKLQQTVWNKMSHIACLNLGIVIVCSISQKPSFRTHLFKTIYLKLNWDIH